MIAYGILNWNRDINPLFASIIKQEGQFIICTNTNKMNAANVHNVDAETSVSKSLNKIIDKANELGADHLFIIEDSIVVKDPTIFQKYLDMMKKFDLGLIFYGFDKANRIFNAKPNPCIYLKMKNDEEVIFNRFISSGCLLIDLKKNKEKFDENLQALEFEDYIFRCKTLGHIPFNGFYLDVNKSWECFERSPVGTLRTKSTEVMKADKAIMDANKIDNKLEFNVDKLFKYLIDKGY